MPDDARWNRLWYGRGSNWPLRPLAALFGALVRARRGLYRGRILAAQRVGAPVVIVGNITVGGTGKTPLCVWLAARLRGRGFAPGIVSRGYGSRAGSGAIAPQLLAATSTPADVGDEALLLQRRALCPVAVGRDRVAAARLLVDAGCNVLVADDGLQHLRLARDFEIAVIDAARGLGNGRLLPAGPLREPAARLASVDAIVCNLGSEDAHAGGAPAPPSTTSSGPLRVTMRVRGDEAVQAGEPATRRPLAAFRGSRVHAVAGIGNPERFFAGLRRAGLDVVPHPFPDHHRFGAADLEFGDALPILMTEKDAVKCAALRDGRYWYVPIDAELSTAEEQQLLERVMGVVGEPGRVGA